MRARRENSEAHGHERLGVLANGFTAWRERAGGLSRWDGAPRLYSIMSR